MMFLLDMDGVLCNFVDSLIESHRWDITHDQWVTWNHHRTFGVTDEVMWSPTRVHGWWHGLNEYPWAGRLVRALRERGDVVFCTSPSSDHKCASEKIQWLRDRGFMDKNKNDFQIGPRKELMAGSGAILIDDYEVNVSKFQENGGRAILFPQPWNENRSVKEDRVDFVLQELSNGKKQSGTGSTDRL
jgi:5'(3')-deoxyribonucleotidase